MIVQCPFCHYSEAVPEEYGGMVGECSNCGKDFRIPSPRSLQQQGSRKNVSKKRHSHKTSKIIGTVLLFIVILGAVLFFLSQRTRGRSGIIIDNTFRGVQLWKNGPYWADRNIGAETPWDYGYYFWYGDTVGYKYKNGVWVASDNSSSGFSFGEENTPTFNKDQSALLREGWITSDNILAPEHDAAHVQWGGGWRMPTMRELDDLCDNCDWTLTRMNGVDGCIVRGRGDYASASIFLPAAGRGLKTSLVAVDLSGKYWSSIPYSGSTAFSVSWNLYFDSNGHESGYLGGHRFYGETIRPVQGFAK